MHHESDSGVGVLQITAIMNCADEAYKFGVASPTAA